MKIISSITGGIYDVPITHGGENKYPCPDCSRDRKKTKNKCFSFNAEKKTGYCNHCNASFFEYKPYAKKKEYVVPEWKNKTLLSDRAVKWFSGRMISQNTLVSMDISSAVEFMISSNASVICFPYYRGDKLINIKFRDGAKNFKLVKDAELIFYNINAVMGQKECIIVEGEIDCLSFIESGVNNVISVPNGAGGKSMEYVDNCYEELSGIELFYIAVDNDLAGMNLKDELVRRFGSEKCKVVNYKDCKDANDYLCQHSAMELKDLLKEAQEIPIKDIVDVGSMYDQIYSLYQNGLQKGTIIHDRQLDELISWETGRLYTVTGIPSHGKSEFLDYIVTRLNVIHKWKVCYFSPENYPLKIHFAKIVSKICGKHFDAKVLSQDEFEKVYDYVQQNFFFIYPEEDITIENILEKAKYLVRKHGIKVLVVDPYNKLEHTRNKNESETEYISRFLDRLSMFGKQNDCVVCLVAHPKKMEKSKDSEKYQVPTLYDISGSAHFYNKTDFGLVVYRDFIEKKISVLVQKVKFKHLGEIGCAEYKYNIVNGRFEQDGSTDNVTYLDRDWNNPKSLGQYYNADQYVESEIPF